MGASLSISITQNSQNVAANTSNVTVAVRISWTYGSFNRNQKSGWLKIDGTQYNFTSGFNASETTSGSQTIFTKTVDVAHGSTGAKTLACSASYTTGVSAGTITASTSKALTTIPRATTPTVSASSVDMGGKVTISTPRAASSFTHDLAYSFAGGSYVAITTGVGTSYSWTTPDLASKIPNATSGTVTIRCITKNGSTTIGTKTVTMTLKVPSSVVPTISALTAVETVTGLAAQFGAFVKGKSKVKGTVTAAGAKGSTIKSYSTTFDGRTYTAASFTSPAVAGTGTLTMKTTVTDSRGRTATKSITVTALDYAKPSITSLSVYRVDDQGAGDPNGVYMVVNATYSVPTMNGKNTARMVMEYKRSTATAWETLQTGTALSGMPPFVHDEEISTDYQYDVRLTVTDWFGASVIRTAVLPSGAVIMDIGADGDCLGIGETAQYPGHVGVAWTLKTKHGEIPRDALVIPAGANLDDYKTPGYYVFSSASAATIVGLPFAAGSGTVEVIPEGEAGQVRQVIARCSDAPREIWERLYYSSKWHDVRCVYKGGTGRVLWSGGYYMTAGQTATLKEPVSKQPTGIMLVFSEFVDGAASDSTFHHRPVLRDWVALHPGKAECIQLSTSNLAFFATKYLYIHDDKIAGHDNNNKTGTGACGITYTNARFVLRYVIGF